MGGCHFHGNKSLPEILPVEIVDPPMHGSEAYIHALFGLYRSLQADKHFVIADVCGGIAQGNGSGCSQHDRTIDNTATGMK